VPPFFGFIHLRRCLTRPLLDFRPFPIFLHIRLFGCLFMPFLPLRAFLPSIIFCCRGLFPRVSSVKVSVCALEDHAEPSPWAVLDVFCVRGLLSPLARLMSYKFFAFHILPPFFLTDPVVVFLVVCPFPLLPNNWRLCNLFCRAPFCMSS